MFFNRKQELAFLKRKFHSNRPKLLIFRGRRRVGKTFLLKVFAHQVNGLYLLGAITSRADQLSEFKNI